MPNIRSQESGAPEFDMSLQGKRRSEGGLFQPCQCYRMFSLIRNLGACDGSHVWQSMLCCICSMQMLPNVISMVNQDNVHVHRPSLRAAKNDSREEESGLPVLSTAGAGAGAGPGEHLFQPISWRRSRAAQDHQLQLLSFSCKISVLYYFPHKAWSCHA
jgi:hypothetical protein